MIEIVEYSEADREAVREICFQTGFLGGTLDGIIDNKDLFLDLATHYFLDVKKDFILTAKDSGKVVGYLFVTPEKQKFKASSTKYYIFRVLIDVFRFRLFSKKEYKYYIRRCCSMIIDRYLIRFVR